MGIKTNIIRTFGKAKLFTIQHSPEICMIAGTVELVATVVSACKATVKFQDTLDRHNRRMARLDEIKEAQANGTAEGADATFDVKAGKIGIWFDTLKDGAKVYLPTGLLMIGTAVTYICGWRIDRKRLINVSGVAASLVTQIRERDAKIEKLCGGEKLAEVMGKNDEDAKIESHVDPETGETVIDKVTYPDIRDTFGIWFDAEHRNYDKTLGANQEYLLYMEGVCTRRLETRGYLYLNDVLRMLEFDEEDLFEAGQYYGWKYYKDPEEAKLHGAANHIDFGCFKKAGVNADFAKGLVREAYLMFNVDPEPITSQLGWRTEGDKRPPKRYSGRPTSVADVISTRKRVPVTC